MGKVARIARLAHERPASLVAFDVLSIDGEDIRALTWTKRRALLESLAADWSPPLQLSPVTSDVEEAAQWMQAYYPAGIEGLVVKGASSRYRPGQREWLKVKRRETFEVLVGGVIGSLRNPEAVIAGRHRDGVLVVVGRTVPLKPTEAKKLAALIEPAGDDHPWPDHIASHRWGGSDSKVELVKVVPNVVIEVAADAALSNGQWRHPLRFVRHRADVAPKDVPAAP